MWDLFTLADQLRDVLQSREDELRLEQAVHGLDHYDERQMQALLAEALTRHYSVAREVHYPSSAGRRLSARQRCDLVLTPLRRPLHLDSRLPTLFDPPDPCPPEQALWVEVKLAQQFRELGVPHGGYGSQWSARVVDDLRKMEADPRICEAALLLVVFTESPEIVAKDLGNFEIVLARKEVLAGFGQARTMPIQDRIGHRCCTVALWPTVQRSQPPQSNDE